METREIIRTRIRELREAQHLTQADMAEKILPRRYPYYQGKIQSTMGKMEATA